MSKCKLIQITNSAVGAVAVDGYMPFGLITRRIQSSNNCCNTFDVTTSNNDLVYLNEPGYYDITYSATVVAGAEGILTLSLISNGTTIYSVGVSVNAADQSVNLTLPYTVRVFPNNPSYPSTCPTSIQIQLSGVAITSGTSNLQIEKVY